MAAIESRDRLIVGLDVPTVAEAEDMVARLGDSVTFYKVGLQLVFAGGLAFAGRLAETGKKVFLDVKLLDIDNTVEGAVANIARMGMTFVTLHAYPKAMRAAVKAKGDAKLGLLGVTVLTSMDDMDLTEAGYKGPVEDLVLRRARDARDAGMSELFLKPFTVETVRSRVVSVLAKPRAFVETPVYFGPDRRRRGAGFDGNDRRRINAARLPPTLSAQAGSGRVRY